MNETEKAIRDNFPGKSNAGLRKELREAALKDRCAMSSIASRVPLTASGKAGLNAVMATMSNGAEIRDCNVEEDE